MLIRNKPVQISLTILFCISFLVTACKSNTPQISTLPNPQISETKLSTITPTQKPTYTPTQEPTPTLPLPMDGNQTKYFIDLTLDYYNRYAEVSQVVIYTNRSSQELSDILMIITPRYFQGSFNLTRVLDVNDQVITNTKWEGTNLSIPLAPALKPGEKITLKLEYVLRFPEREGTYGMVGRQLNLANWYPFIPPYSETSGWVFEEMQIVNSFVVGEHLVYESSDFEVNLKFTDRRENFKVAASAPSVDENGVLRYKLKLARGFVFSISDVFVVQEIEHNGITIRSFVFPGNQQSGLAAMEMAGKALDLYGELFTPYQRDLFTIVEAEFLHNMEFDGMAFISYGVIQFYNGKPDSNLTILTPHETSHQWFFSLVGNNQATEPWLDEALATYSEVLYYERYHPDFVQWWWTNRVDGFDPKGFVNSSIYINNGYEPYRDAVYLRGARFMQELRIAVGDNAFFAFLKDYVETFSFKVANHADFFNTLALHTDVDISPVMSEFFSQQ